MFLHRALGGDDRPEGVRLDNLLVTAPRSGPPLSFGGLPIVMAGSGRRDGDAFRCDHPGGEILVYEDPDGRVRVDVRLDRETVWLSLTQTCDQGSSRSDQAAYARSVGRVAEGPAINTLCHAPCSK